MKKVRTIGFLKVSITNRGIYTLSLLALAVVLAILVYAINPGQPLLPGQTPNPGHPPSELGIPSPCASGQFLEYKNKGWVCGSGSLWGKSGSNIFYNSGNVGIGTTTPTSKLEVNGNIKADSGIILGGVRKTSWPRASLSCISIHGSLGAPGHDHNVRCPVGYTLTGGGCGNIPTGGILLSFGPLGINEYNCNDLDYSSNTMYAEAICCKITS